MKGSKYDMFDENTSWVKVVRKTIFLFDDYNPDVPARYVSIKQMLTNQLKADLSCFWSSKYTYKTTLFERPQWLKGKRAKGKNNLDPIMTFKKKQKYYEN